MGEAQHGLDDDGIVRFPPQSLDEQPIDLQAIEGDAPQLAERSRSGPEVVQREADSEALEIVEDPGRAEGIIHHGAFADLQYQPLGLQTRAVENVSNLAREP